MTDQPKSKRPIDSGDKLKITNNTALHEATVEDSDKTKLRKIKEIKSKNNTIEHEYEPMFVWEEYQHMRSLKRIPINNVWIDALAKEMTKWIDENPQVIRFDEFLQKKAMLDKEFRRLAAKSSILHRAWEYCLRGIARNREIGAWNGKNWAVASYNLAYYCDITKQESERRAKLKETVTGDNGAQIIVIPSVEDFEKHLAEEEKKMSK